MFLVLIFLFGQGVGGEGHLPVYVGLKDSVGSPAGRPKVGGGVQA